MLPGKNMVYGCPQCGRKVIVGSLQSGNNAGAILYSDGMQDAPMLPQFPCETKCKKCGTIFDFKKQTLVKILNSPLAFEPDCDDAAFLTIEDYNTKIESNQGDECQNRLMMWHTANGTYGKQKRRADTDLYQDNCKRLIDLLIDTQDIDEKIMLAELYRNIGDFDSCVNAISLLDGELEWLKRKFIRQCVAKNPHTCIIKK